VSVWGARRAVSASGVGQDGERERSTDDVSKAVIDGIETGRPAQPGSEPGGRLLVGQVVSGMEPAQHGPGSGVQPGHRSSRAQRRPADRLRPPVAGRRQRPKRPIRSRGGVPLRGTGAGPDRSSDEGPVMGLERTPRWSSAAAPPPQRERATRSARPCPSSGPPTLLSPGLMPPSPGPRHRRPFDDPLSGPLLRQPSPLRRRAAPPTGHPRLGTASRDSILSTDLGQRGNPPVEDGVALMARAAAAGRLLRGRRGPMAVANTRPVAGPQVHTRNCERAPKVIACPVQIRRHGRGSGE
jgi:hypothetical protein